MRSRLQLAAIICAVLSTTSVANPPQGIFSATVPTAPRYPVTLVIDYSDPTPSSVCGESYALSLTDATGETVADPFVVPASQKFVLTDVDWTVETPTAAKDSLVQLTLAGIFPGTGVNKPVTLHAEQNFSNFASGSRSFIEGPIFLGGSSLCASATWAQLNDGGALFYPRIQVSGYLLEDSQIP